MSSLIEKAAQRLEQLRQTGIEVPTAAPHAGAVATTTDRRIGVPDDAPPVVGFPGPTGGQTGTPSRRVELDLATISANGIVLPNAPRSMLADQFRVLKRPLLANALGRGAAPVNRGNLIMVTSALPGEGKTFTSINLAMSIAAELDHTVLLVDADVARPSVLRALGVPAGPGLLELLEGKASMAEVLLRTNVDKLSILPSGTPQLHATELLASDAMERLLDELATRYPDRIVIFDSPPLLLTTEARVLATHMGQIVVVVQAERTLQRSVQEAIATIEACPVKLMVLNRARASAEGSYATGYGHKYGPGYGYGYGAGEVAAGGAAIAAAPSKAGGAG